VSARDGFLLRHLLPAVLLAALLLSLDATHIDSAMSAWFYDPVSASFPLRYNSTLELWGHQVAKEAIIVLAGCVIAMYLLSFLLPDLAPRRRVLLYLSLALTLAPLAVVLMKAASARHCPWSLREFGGFAPHLNLFDPSPAKGSPGHCFPSGHASGGFCLFAFYFAGRATGSRRLALAGLWGGIAVGLGFGMVRIVQGAHFLSHNLWSALVCWLVGLALYVAIFGASPVVAGARTSQPAPDRDTRP